MEIVSPIHGKFLYEEKDIITFEKSIPGFENSKKFIIKEVEDSGFYIIQSLEEVELGFILISPFSIIENYEIRLNEEIINNLEIKDEKEVVLYSVITLNSDIEKITANLKAPIVINNKTNKGEQYITENNKYNIRQKVYK
ncbi:flagellar assembly protein FliW [Clostridium sp.]|uniref:flagellar assembly protein FliW n=1 Tax=Clostridium sp. TaxID=1506 RepID=UPI0026075696|nr:flagellar assembly protein FliW [Clostridium sp.]